MMTIQVARLLNEKIAIPVCIEGVLYTLPYHFTFNATNSRMRYPAKRTIEFLSRLLQDDLMAAAAIQSLSESLDTFLDSSSILV